MLFIRATIVALSLFLSASISLAAQTGCPEHFAGGQAPDFINRKLANRAREVCYSEYGLMHSGVTRTPLYAAEHLTRGRVEQARTMKRSSKFFPDPHIPYSERAELRYYQRSGYDRGHMAPSADMSDELSQQECFSLANIVPQDPENNRGKWEGIESAVRKLARERGSCTSSEVRSLLESTCSELEERSSCLRISSRRSMIQEGMRLGRM